LQPGGVLDTYTDVNDFVEEFGYKPLINVQQGVYNFVRWYKEYHDVQKVVSHRLSRIYRLCWNLSYY